MGLFTNGYRERRQQAGNLCLVLFLALLCSTYLLPIAMSEAMAAPKPDLEVIESNVSVAGNQIQIDMLLQTPVTDEHFETIVVDFSNVTKDSSDASKVTVAANVYSSIYGDVYQYAVNFVYTAPEGTEISQDKNSPVFIRDNERNLVQVELVKLEVKPPEGKKSKTKMVLAAQNARPKFPVGSIVSIDVKLDNRGQNNKINGADFVLNYDPDKLSFNGFTIAAPDNIHVGPTADTSKGTVTFATAGDLYTRGGSATVNLVTLQFQVLQTGASNLAFSLAEVSEETGGGTEVLNCPVNELTITGGDFGQLSGQVQLVDRVPGSGTAVDHSGVIVDVYPAGATAKADSTTTDSNGNYQFALDQGTYQVWATYPKHLRAVKDVTVVTNLNTTAPTINLLSGDANNDNEVSLLDLVILADEYPKTDTGTLQSDFNGDGRVSLADLAVLAKNFLLKGDK